MRIFTSIITTLLVCLSISAGNVKLNRTTNASAQPKQAIAEGKTITMTKVLGAYFQRDNTHISAGGASNYYIILADNESATYDKKTSKVVAKSTNVLILDLYSQKTATAILESDEFTPVTSTPTSGTYVTSNTFSQWYNFAGKLIEKDDDYITGNVSVTRLDSDNTYRIEATALNGNTYVYEGRIIFLDSNSDSYQYPQIRADVDATYTGGLAFYNGNVYESNTGNMWINLFTCEFDSITGGMKDVGYNLSLMAFNRLFGNAGTPAIVPGTYTVATTFEKNTYYPGTELMMDGMAIPFGSYIKQRKAMTGNDDDYAYSYINNGTFTVEANEDGTFNFDIDMYSADGFRITGRANHIGIEILDEAEDEVYISNLTEDVILDLDYIKTARIYRNNREGADGHGYNRWLLDIGSPSGKDGTEGDIFRMELLADPTLPCPPIGVYNVMERDKNYYNLFAPYTLLQGYFFDGGLDGTRYMHFEEGRYCVMDLLAPAYSGKVSFEKVGDTDNYHFVIDVYDDAQFSISGEWTGPIQGYTYVGIDDVLSDKKLEISYLDNENIVLNNMSENELVNLYSTDGRLVFSQLGATQIDLSGLSNGIYILHVENYQEMKIIKK